MAPEPLSASQTPASPSRTSLSPSGVAAVSSSSSLTVSDSATLAPTEAAPHADHDTSGAPLNRHLSYAPDTDSSHPLHRYTTISARHDVEKHHIPRRVRSHSISRQTSDASLIHPAADLSFPYTTTNIPAGGITDEYHKVTHTGLVPIGSALHPVESRAIPLSKFWSNDPEKARRLKDVQLVTWKEDDPENPRNWSAGYRWCK